MWLAIMHATAPSLWPSSLAPARAASPVDMALSTDGIDYSGIAHDQMSTSETSALRQLGLEVGVTEQLLDAAFDAENPRGTLIRLIRARLWYESSYAHTLGHIFVDRDRLEQYVLVPLPDAALSDMMGRAVWNGIKATPTIQCGTCSKGPSTAADRGADAIGYACEARGCRYSYETKNGSCVCQSLVHKF